MTIRARYNAMPSDKNPYLKKNWRPDKTLVRVGILYIIGLITAWPVWYGMAIRFCWPSCRRECGWR